MQFSSIFAFGSCADDYPKIFGFDGLNDFLKPFSFFC